jgi:hypothetical protein
MKLAPGPRRAAASGTSGSHKGFFASMAGWLPKLLPLLGNILPIMPATSPEGGSSHAGPVTMPSPVVSVVQGIHTLLSVFDSGGNASSKGPLQVIISDAGSLDANQLASHFTA